MNKDRSSFRETLTKDLKASYEETVFSHAEVGVAGDDDVIQEFDAEERAGISEPLRYIGVVIGWVGVAGGVIVGNYHLCRRVNNGAFEYFSRVYQALGERADGDGFTLDFLVSGVEVEHNEVFFLK